MEKKEGKIIWSYYGRKWKIINKYPEPIYDLIIEPFAGTASYAYKYWDRDVILIDKFDKIIKIWKYLQDTTTKQILSLPDIENGQHISTVKNYSQLCSEEKWLMGFCFNNASESPRHTAGRMNFNSWKRDKIRIANDLYKIKHWKFILGEFNCLDNLKSTWYIDPPYRFQNRYKFNNINYKELADWCKFRNGQVIVCENFCSERWLNFKPLVELSGQRKKSTEVIWYKE